MTDTTAPKPTRQETCAAINEKLSDLTAKASLASGPELAEIAKGLREVSAQGEKDHCFAHAAGNKAAPTKPSVSR